MRAWSFSLGRIFGVDVRLHLLIPLVLSFSILWASVLGHPAARGVLLWLLLLLAIAVRETARALAYAWSGVEARSLLLLPTGGVLEARPGGVDALSNRERRVMALAGPVASFSFALLLAGVAFAVSPEVDVLGQRWVSPLHLLRSAVWINLLMGAVNLLPAWPLDGAGAEEAGRAAAVPAGPEGGGEAAGQRTGSFHQPGVAGRRLVGLSIAIGLVVMGIVTATGGYCWRNDGAAVWAGSTSRAASWQNDPRGPGQGGHVDGLFRAVGLRDA